MKVSILTSRGSEKFVEKPLFVATKLGSSQPSVFDLQRTALAQMRAEEQARIKNEEELLSDLYDFSYVTEVDDYGFPSFTTYAVPDSVPDVYVPQKAAAPAPVAQTEPQNSASKDGVTPSGGDE